MSFILKMKGFYKKRQLICQLYLHLCFVSCTKSESFHYLCAQNLIDINLLWKSLMKRRAAR